MTVCVSGTSKAIALLLGAGPANKEVGRMVLSGDRLTLMMGIGITAAPIVSVLQKR